MDRPLSPEERAEATRRVGSGIFSYLQLQRELARRRAAAKPSMEETGPLKIPLPKELLLEASTKMGEEEMFPEDGTSRSVIPTLLSQSVKNTAVPFSLGTTLTEGFGQAKNKYYQDQKARMRQELENAKREYLDTLMQIRKKASTPAVDALCIGMASVLDPKVIKEASDSDELGDHATQQLITDIIRKAVMSNASPVHMLKTPLTYAAGAAVSPALLAGYMTYNSQRPKRDEGQQKFNSPMKVELQPY